MDINSTLLTAATLGLGGTVLLSLKSIPSLILAKFKEKFVYSVTIYHQSELYNHFDKWFKEYHENKFRNVEVKYLSREMTIDSSSKEEQDIQLGQKTGYFFIKHNGTRLHILKEKKELNVMANDVFLNTYVISSFNKNVVNNLLKEIKSKYESNNKTKLFTTNEYGDWLLMRDLQERSLENIILGEGVKSQILSDINKWLTEEDWYHSLNISYKRSFLLYGPPGNGKTSLSIALSQYYKKDIYCIDFNAIRDDASLKMAFRYLKKNSILLIEDIDKAFTKRQSKETKGISFSCLLNCLDGVFQKEGIITIMSTNHIENLDPALIRSGRVDSKILIENPCKDQVNRYLTRFYQTPVEVEYKKSLCMADIQGICIKNKNSLQDTLKELL